MYHGCYLNLFVTIIDIYIDNNIYTFKERDDSDTNYEFAEKYLENKF